MRLSELVKFLIRALQIQPECYKAHRHFSCDLPGLRIQSLVPVKRVERCNWTRFKLNSAREMKKKLGVEELRDT